MRIYKAKDVRVTCGSAVLVGLDTRTAPDDVTPKLYATRCPTCGKSGPAAYVRQWWRKKEYFPCAGDCDATFKRITEAMDVAGL